MPDTGYHFVDWSDCEHGQPEDGHERQANISVTANFAINTYTLTYTAGANGTITGTSPQTVAHGAAARRSRLSRIPATTSSTGPRLATAARTDTNVTSNITVTANFAINTYTLTYSAGANGSITGTSPQTVAYGAGWHLGHGGSRTRTTTSSTGPTRSTVDPTPTRTSRPT